MSRCTARCRGDGRSALLSVRRVVALVVALGLAVAGCGSEGADRREASETTAAEQSAASSSANGVASGTPTPLATPLPTAAATSPDTDGEPSPNQDELVEETPVAAPSATPAVEATLDVDDSNETGTVEDSDSPASPEGGSPERERVNEENLPLPDPEVPPQAEDVIVIESFNVRECVMRGMLRNQSDRLFARDVVLTIESPDGSKNASWHWPLMMLPGEQAPFEININWTRKELAETTLPGSTWMESYGSAQETWDDIRFSITANLSKDPDVSRSFTWNADGTEGYNLFQSSHDFLVYDDRIFESEDWYDYQYRGGRAYSLLHRTRFDSIYPNRFVISNDLDPILSRFEEYDFSDIYYTPEVMTPGLRYKTPEIPYPNYYDPANDQIAENVKAFQAIFRQGIVIDVRELILHTVKEDIDADGNVTKRTMTPIAELVNYNSGTAIPAYVRVTTPMRVDGPYGSWDYSRRLWIGKAGQGDPFATLKNISQVSNSIMEQRGVPRGTCDLPGGLAVQDFAIQSNSGIAGQVFNISLGSFGAFDAFEPSLELIDDVIIEDDTVTVIDGVIRGLVHNLSGNKFARDVTVTAVLNDGSEESASWHWPLTVQPGERAPFEIVGWTGVIHPEAFDLWVSASFSEQVDISRAFRIEGSANFGNVYSEDERDSYNRERHSNEDPGDYKDYNLLWQHRNYLLQDEFDKLYQNVVVPYFNIEVKRFEYSEIYASIVSADSHPSLDGKIDTQAIDELYAYRAIFNSNMEVMEVHELIPFTSVYSSDSPYSRRLMPVTAIPTPNVWIPKTVQLLLIWPADSEEDSETYHSNQVWIGGALEPRS